MNINRILYNFTGIMPKKEIMRTCKNIGRHLADDLQAGDVMSAQKVERLLTEKIGPKKSKNIIVSDQFEVYRNFAKQLKMDDDIISLSFILSKSAVLSDLSNRTLLSLRLDGLSVAEALNISAHELEHTLFQNLSTKSYFSKFLQKLLGKKRVDKLLTKNYSTLQEKSVLLNQELLKLYKSDCATEGTSHCMLNLEGLVKCTGTSTLEGLRKSIKELVQKILVEDPKESFKILSVLRANLKDEIRAYKSGGAAERYWNTINGLDIKEANKSEMYALLHEEVLKEIKRVQYKTLFDRIKSILLFRKSKPVNTITTNEKSCIDRILSEEDKKALAEALKKALDEMPKE